MKTIKILLSTITVIFALLGLFNVISFDITIPFMLTSLATLMLIIGAEFKNHRNNSGYLVSIIAALFIYLVVIYNVFIG